MRQNPKHPVQNAFSHSDKNTQIETLLDEAAHLLRVAALISNSDTVVTWDDLKRVTDEVMALYSKSKVEGA